MRISLFRGNFNDHQGLICFCHVHSNDENKINKTVLQITNQRNLCEEKVVVVPFCHLDKKETKMDFYGAEKLLRRVASNLPNAVFLPYRKENPFSLNMPSLSHHVSFLEF